MFTKVFWKDAFERGVKSAAQALVLLWVVADQAFNILEADLEAGIGVAAGAFVLSVLTSLGTGLVTANSTASAVKQVDYKA